MVVELSYERDGCTFIRRTFRSGERHAEETELLVQGGVIGAFVNRDRSITLMPEQDDGAVPLAPTPAQARALANWLVELADKAEGGQ